MGVAGAVYAVPVVRCGSGSARWSILPLAVSGIVSTGTKALGTR